MSEDKSYRDTAARNWAESGRASRHGESPLVDARHAAVQGYPEDHPSVVFHQDMLGKVQREREHYDSVLPTPSRGEAGSALPSIGGLLGHMREREPKTPTIENAMDRRAWKHEGAGPDADG